MQPDKTRSSRFVTVVIGALVTLSVIALLVISLGTEGPSGYLKSPPGPSADGASVADKAALEALKAADPLHIEALVGLARIAREEGRLLDAAKQWSEIVALDPLNEQARFEQVRNVYAVGDYQSVLGLVSQGLLAENPDAQVLHVLSLLATRRAEEADAVLTSSIARYPGHPQTQLLHADRLFFKGQVAEAEALYHSLQDNATVADGAFFGVAQIHFYRGDKTQAASVLLEHPPSGDAAFQTVKARAELWRQMGKLDHAIDSYQQLVVRYGAIADAIVPLAELVAYRGDAQMIAQLRSELAAGSAAALAAHHYLEALEAYLLKEPEAVLSQLGWAEKYYGQRDVFRWAELDASLQVADLARAKSAVAALQRMNLTELRRLHAADLVAARAADWAGRSAFDDAAALAKLAFLLAPEHPGARLVLARVALVNGQDKRAEALAKGLLAENELRVAALEILGRVSMEGDDFATADEYFRQMVAISPELSTAHYWVGVSLFRQQQYQQAADALQLAYQISPNDPRVASALLDALIKAQRWSQGRELAERQTQAKDAISRAIGWAFKAGIHRALGEPGLAAAAYRRAMQEDPERLAYALSAADLLIDQQEYSPAEAILAGLAERDPENRVVRFKQAYVAQLQGNVQVAGQRYRELLEDYPRWSLVLLNLSELLSADRLSRGDALAMARDAAKLSPDWDRAHWNLAQRAYESGDMSLAFSAANQVLVLAPADQQAQAMVAKLGSQR